MNKFQFSSLEGNAVTLSILKRGILSNSLKNVIILSGPYGTGKSTTAITLALRLTCESPNEAEPCLECGTCKVNIRAMQGSGTSSRISKKNVSLFKDKEDIKALINEIFVLKGSEENEVYIFEETHDLPKFLQTPLLDEIDRIGENTYLIFPTTRAHNLLPELLDRGITYEFRRLLDNEMRKLLDRLVHRELPPRAEETLIRYSKGTPRTLINMLSLLKGAQPSEDELQEFLGYIDDRIFSDLFRACMMSLKDVSYVLDPLLQRYSTELVVNQLKEFVTSLVFSVTTGDMDEVNKELLKSLQELLTEDHIFKIANVVEKLSPQATSTDVRLAMIRLTQSLRGKSFVSPLTDNKVLAAQQGSDATKIVREENVLRNTVLHAPPAATIESMRSFRREKSDEGKS